MKKYNVNGKIVVADSLRDAIVKYRLAHDSVKDRLGEGKCAPTGSDTLISDANAILSSINEIGKTRIASNRDVGYYFNRAAELEEKIAKERKTTDDFDKYWQDHRREILDNATAAEKIIKQIWSKLK